MIVVPFQRLPRKSYDPREDIPRVDIEYLQDYESETYSSSNESERSFMFSDGSSDSEESYGSPQTGEYSSFISENMSADSYDEEADIVEEPMNESSKITGSVHSVRSQKRKKHGFLKRLKMFIRRRKSYVRFQNWRKRKAEERRHFMIRMYEAKAEDEYHRAREEILNKIREDEMLVLKTAKRLRKVQKTLVIRNNASFVKDHKFEHEKVVRKKEMDRLEFNVLYFQKWALENFHRHNEEAEAKRIEDIAAENKRLKQLQARKKEEFGLDDESKLQADIAETQSLHRMARKHGTRVGVNAICHQVIPEPLVETTRKLFLRLRDDVDFSWKPKHMRTRDQLMPFTVDLRSYRDVETLVAVNIGEIGCLALSAEFVRGSCSNVVELDMSRCQIHSRGFGRLLHGLRIGRVMNLRTLKVRGNALCPSALDFLRVGECCSNQWIFNWYLCVILYPLY